MRWGMHRWATGRRAAVRFAIGLPVVALALAGCGVEILTTTAITSELRKEEATAMNRQLATVQDAQTQQNAQRAVDAWRAEHGTPPPTLETLVPQYLDAVPTRADGSPWYYDAGTGRVSRTAPSPAAVNRERIARIEQAINAYGTATGWYPPTLEALVPQYLDAVPVSASGAPFRYNNQNGYVGVPQTQAPPQPGQPTNFGAPPPQRSNDPHDIGDAHTQRQHQVMDDLGL